MTSFIHTPLRLSAAAQVFVDCSRSGADKDTHHEETNRLVDWVTHHPQASTVHVHLRRGLGVPSARQKQAMLQAAGCTVTAMVYS